MDSNREMVDRLVEKGKIESEVVEKAFRSVDRADFVPEDKKAQAYEDRPLRIAESATISAPHMVAINTELLEPTENDKVLEIGSGSGYQLAILTEIVDEVVGVEIDKMLADSSRNRLEQYRNTTVVHGSGLDSLKENFDKIIYSFAVESVDKVFKYLKDGGMVLAPVKEGNNQILKRFKGDKVERHGKVRFVGEK